MDDVSRVVVQLFRYNINLLGPGENVFDPFHLRMTHVNRVIICSVDDPNNIF